LLAKICLITKILRKARKIGSELLRINDLICGADQGVIAWGEVDIERQFRILHR
jgi:hypothetical protein